MPKFKVGDRVKLISKEPKWLFGPYVRTGDVGYVRSLDSTHGTELCVDFPKHKLWRGMESEFVLASKSTTTTQKPKEPKTMSTTKKPGTTHGKPTVRGMKVEKKPTTAKVSKYPAPREALGIMIPDYRNPKSKATKADLVDQVFDLLDTALDARKDLATTGTKLDRALVDLKEAKKRIKELSKELEAAK